MSLAHDPSRKRGELQRRATIPLLSLVDLHFTRGDSGRCDYLEDGNQMHTHVISSRISLFFLFCVLLLLAACGQTATPPTSQSTATPATTPTPAPVDAYGTPIAFPKTAPQRIVSLAASTSEILGSLNLADKIVGVDFYTDYPDTLTKKQRISDASGNYNVESIVALKPDLVLSSGGLTKPYDTKLAALGLHVIDLPNVTFAQMFQQISLVGELTFTQDAAKQLVSQLQQETDQIKAKVAGTSEPKVLLEVDDTTPGKPFVFGGGSFGDELLDYANATNIFHANTTNGGYPQVTDETIIAANPQFVILTEDPQYGGKPETVYKRPNWGGIEAVKTRQVYHINTDLMQRPGPRLVQGLRCVAQIVHPGTFSESLPAYCSATQ